MPNAFIPYKIRFSPFSEPHIIGSDQTPTGAFSYDGYLYVFAFGREDQNNPTTAASYLTRSQYPFDSSVYDLVFTASPENGKFFQVAPHVIRNEELKGLPAENGDGLIMFGYGQEHVYLAWMPLTPGRVPALEDMRYFNNGNWLANESDAAPLFEKTAWTSFIRGTNQGNGIVDTPQSNGNNGYTSLWPGCE